MPFQIIRGDITAFRVDAVVNAANSGLLGGGGVDGAIHRAAGPALREYCRKLGGCPVGEVRLSPGFGLPAHWILHTVGPIWQGGDQNEEALLRTCYRSALALAEAQGFASVAFPLISSGAYGYPKDQALHVAVQEIGSFLLEHEMTVILVIYDKADFRLSESLFPAARSYLDRCLSESPGSGCASMGNSPSKRAWRMFRRAAKKEQPDCPVADAATACEDRLSLDERLRCLDESFSQMLLRKIDEKGMTDVACYKRANVDRKLFSKIRSDPSYRPSKPTAIAFAIALELPLPEARELLMKAGFALSHSNKFDIIIEYFLSEANYNIFEINEALFAFDQTLLGAQP